jgi:toxin ParE1/3/4
VSFRLTPRAEADITAIALYIAEDNPTAAVRWYNEMLRHCRNLGEAPDMGVARPDVRPDLRTFPAGNYMILYRKLVEGAEIVRVVHGARQWQKLLG